MKGIAPEAWLLAFALSCGASVPSAAEVPEIGPATVIRAEVGELAAVMAALRVHGGTLESGFIASFQPFLRYRPYPESVAQHAWEAERDHQRHIIVWVDDPADREPVLLIVHALYHSPAAGGGGTLSVYQTNPAGVLVAAMRSELTPYRPAAYSGPQAEAAFAAEKAYWRAWEMTMRGQPRGALRP